MTTIYILIATVITVIAGALTVVLVVLKRRKTKMQAQENKQ